MIQVNPDSMNFNVIAVSNKAMRRTNTNDEFWPSYLFAYKSKPFRQTPSSVLLEKFKFLASTLKLCVMVINDYKCGTSLCYGVMWAYDASKLTD